MAVPDEFELGRVAWIPVVAIAAWMLQRGPAPQVLGWMLIGFFGLGPPGLTLIWLMAQLWSWHRGYGTVVKE